MTATVDAGTRRVTTAKAISEAIAQEMRSNPEVFVMGEDVGPYGGIFGSTGGLFEEFGSARIIDTPLQQLQHQRRQVSMQNFGRGEGGELFLLLGRP